MTSNLTLERRGQQNKTVQLGGLMMTPPIDEDYWAYRVKLTDRQAIVGFPKFGTIGIGFAVEDDWNTNLPYSVETEQIFRHIARNKGDDSISDEDVKTAIKMVQEAIREDKE